MPKHVREKRTLSKKIVVYCEGDTEEHYLNGLKKWVKLQDPSIDVKIKPECVHGGGYKSFYDELRKEPDSNCIARVVLLDLDRYVNHAKERAEFKKIVELSKLSMNGRVPCILVGSYSFFEYSLCCHDPQYKDTDIAAFLKRSWGYSSLEKCKADAKIWDKAHSGKRSHDEAIDHLKKRPKAIKNCIGAVKRNYSVELKSVSFDENELSGYGSNFGDLFEVINAVR